MSVSERAKSAAHAASNDFENFGTKVLGNFKHRSRALLKLAKPPWMGKGGKSNDEQRARVLMYKKSGGFDDVEIQTVPIPVPKDKQIRVAVKFAGVNFLDVLKKLGVYPGTERFPFVSGVEASGVVDAIGPNVEGFQTGDRVLAINPNSCFGDYVCFGQERIIKLPENVSLEDAACLFVNYVTAYDLLFKLGCIQPKQILLLPQASGGVGHAVIQLLQTVPDVTIIALASSGKHAHLKSLGVKYCIDYKKEDYVAEVRKISPKGVDLVFDSLNGKDATKAFDLLKPYGKVIHYGATNLSGEHRSLYKSATTWWDALSMTSIKIINTNRMMGGYNLNYVMKDEPEQAIATLQKLVQMLGNKEIKPKIDSIYPLTQGKEALLRLVQRKNIGKVLLSPSAQEVSILSDKQITASESSVGF